MAFAVKGAEATPDAFVTTVIEFKLLLKVPDAPDAGAVKTTFAPATGVLPAARTVTASALANTELVAPD